MPMTLATRTIAVHALRTTTATQITSLCADNAGGRCAIGVIAEAFGCNPTDPCSDPYGVDEVYDIPTTSIYIRNDGMWPHHYHTFAQIANWLEQQPVADPCPDTIPWNTPIEAGAR